VRASALPCLLLAGVACERAPEGTAPTETTANSAAAFSSPIAASATASTLAVAPTPPRPLAALTQDGLLALLGPFDPAAEAFVRKHVDVGGPAAMNQGNQEIAHHAISRERCLEGLRALTLQTPAERRLCGDHANMVPIYEDGDPASARACIDLFEFPNQPCELPFVWAGPAQGQALCKQLGKRLCTQEEWMLACDADPAGGERWRYAYGNRLDLEVCNTNKRGLTHHREPCDATTARSAWKTCGTHTEPSGSFPRCRSRLGVFDLHGNVAEAMTRRDPDGKTYSQLKGSAFFYVDVQREDGGKQERENYPDVCRHDPRWHVQHMPRAWHVNYHLGFRCCVDVGS
jgi:hypothetical protein